MPREDLKSGLGYSGAMHETPNLADSRLQPGELIAGGAQKRVYEDASNPDRVVAVLKHESVNLKENPIQLKGRYYLGKLLHLLHPESFPDVNYATGKSNALILERIKMDDAEEGETWSETSEAERTAFADRIRAETGMIVDKRFKNFLRRDGELVYVDNEPAWEAWHRYKEAERLYDPELLHATLDKLPDERRGQGMKYLERLEALNAELMETYSPMESASEDAADQAKKDADDLSDVRATLAGLK